MQKRFLTLLTAATLSTFTFISCGDSATTEETTTDTVAAAPAMEEGVMVGGAAMVPSKNIVENAAASNDHTTLVAAVKAADLAETLSGPGPFTVFAPTNEAFNELPPGTVDDLLKPSKKADLTSVLTYHVVPGTYMAADLTDGQKLKTVQGKELTVSIKNDKVMINGATVTTPNVVSSNGVTHVIDGVLLP